MGFWDWMLTTETDRRSPVIGWCLFAFSLTHFTEVFL